MDGLDGLAYLPCKKKTDLTDDKFGKGSWTAKLKETSTTDQAVREAQAKVVQRSWIFAWLLICPLPVRNIGAEAKIAPDVTRKNSVATT